MNEHENWLLNLSIDSAKAKIEGSSYDIFISALIDGLISRGVGEHDAMLVGAILNFSIPNNVIADNILIASADNFAQYLLNILLYSKKKFGNTTMFWESVKKISLEFNKI